MAMKVSKMWVTSATVQLQPVAVSSAKKPAWQAAAAGRIFDIGSQNTLKP